MEYKVSISFGDFNITADATEFNLGQIVDQLLSAKEVFMKSTKVDLPQHSGFTKSIAEKKVFKFNALEWPDEIEEFSDTFKDGIAYEVGELFEAVGRIQSGYNPIYGESMERIFHTSDLHNGLCAEYYVVAKISKQ